MWVDNFPSFVINVASYLSIVDRERESTMTLSVRSRIVNLYTDLYDKTSFNRDQRKISILSILTLKSEYANLSFVLAFFNLWHQFE